MQSDKCQWDEAQILNILTVEVSFICKILRRYNARHKRKCKRNRLGTFVWIVNWNHERNGRNGDGYNGFDPL